MNLPVKLVPEAKYFWKMLSVHAATVSVIVVELYENVSVFQSFLSESAFRHLTAVLFVLVILARLVQQRDNTPSA